MTKAISTDIQQEIFVETTPLEVNAAFQSMAYGWPATIAGKAATTQKTYNKVLKVFFDWLQNHAVARIDEFVLIDFSNWAKAKSNSTARLYNVVVKKFIRWTCQKQRIADFTAFVESIKPDNEETHKRAALNVEEGKAVIKIASHKDELKQLFEETAAIVKAKCKIESTDKILFGVGDFERVCNRSYLKVWNGKNSKRVNLPTAAREAVKTFYQTRLQVLRDLAMIDICLKCGLRTIEVQRMDVEDIQKRGNKYFANIQGKGRSSKSDKVILPPTTKAKLDEYLKFRADFVSRTKKGNNSESKENPMFISLSKKNYGGRVDVSVVAKACRAALNAAGLKSKDGYSPHSLRHAAACIALKAGKSLEQVRQLLRHRDLSTTTIYVRDTEFWENDSTVQIELKLEG